MMGTGTFAEPTFEALLKAEEDVVGLVTQPDRDAGNKRGSTRQTGKGMAAIAGIAGVPVLQPESINTPEGITALKAFAPDLLVVAAYGQILKPAVIEIPARGAINVHASLLPKYRGAAPVAHAILNGESETGVTIIRITPGLDAGEMLAKALLPILPDETAGELEVRLAPLGAGLAVDVIRKLKAGPVAGEKQDPGRVTKAPKLTKEMGAIDWTQPAEKIGRLVRAMQPWPTAYTFLHKPGKESVRVLVTRVRNLGPVEGVSANRSAVGTVITLDPDRLIVPAFDGSSVVEILELQPAGKKKMSAAEFLRGHPAGEGVRFGAENDS
jgi:methionyl-tRNA formyltransferase